MNEVSTQVNSAQIVHPDEIDRAGLPLDIPLLSGFKSRTDFAACVMPLLRGLAWRGDLRHVAESLPHFAETLDLSGFRNVMANLRYRSRPVRERMHRLDPRLLPCLFVPDMRSAVVVLENKNGVLTIFNGATGNYEKVPPGDAWRGVAFFFDKIDEEELRAKEKKAGWFRTISDRFRPLVYQILAVTMLLNILALATPLFIMAVYDKVVATGSLSTLTYFGMGVAIALFCDVALRGIRTKIMAFVGARLDNIVGNAIFERILFLPPTLTERATIGAQVARIKDFESIRDFFTGPLAVALFELPFVFLFISVIGALGGAVAFVPVIMFVLFIVVAAILLPLVRENVSRASRAASKKQEFTVEAISNMRAIRYTGGEKIWMDRYREQSAKAAFANYQTAKYNAIIQNLSHVLMVIAGLSTIAFGVFKVFEGEMSTGGLVASMILVWRVLAPLQTLFTTATRLEQVRSSILQLDNLMAIKAERTSNSIVAPLPKLRGKITFARVSLRYRADADPALIGVSFEVSPGEVVAIVGGNGAGKSTILKLINAMYYPQGGNVRIDNMDVRQLDPIELRQTVSYAPQKPEFFYGTVAQNLRLAEPTASDDDLKWACEKANILPEVEQLISGDGKWMRQGFEARLSDTTIAQMPTSLKQGLNLARSYLKHSPVMLFDEPGNGLDFEGDQAFMKAIDEFKGNSTVLLVTHRPSHLRMADKIVWLEGGRLRMFGEAEEVKKHLPRDFL